MNGVENKDADGIQSLDRLYGRLGFLLRRAHQIAEGVFYAECAAFDLTPPQAGCLVVANSRPGLDQNAIGLALGFDRATTGEILKGLEARGLISRAPSKSDGRKRSIAVTARGKKVLQQGGGALERSQERLLTPFSAEEGSVLVSLLERLCKTYNGEARAALAWPERATT